MTDTQVNLSRKARIRAFLPAAAWYAVIFAFSAQTGEESGELSGAIVHGSVGLMGELGALFRTDWDALQLLSLLVRKGAHMGVFFILTGLLFLGFRKLWTDRKACMTWAMGLCAVLAALDEFHQLFVPGRDGKLSDVLIDTCGAVCFLLFSLALSSLRRAWKRREGPEQ